MQELFVVLVALTLVGHICGNILDHSFQNGNHLFRKMLELLALIVKLVPRNRVVQMDLYVQDILVFFYDLTASSLGNHIKHFGNVTTMSRKDSEFLRVQNEIILGQFLEESFQVESPLVDKFYILIAELLWR